jgi:GNAT superfamily N-acetyltransferase
MRLIALTAGEAQGRQPEIVAVYRAAFAPPPYNRGESAVGRFAESFARHCRQPGFQCLAVELAPGRPIAGFAYGYRSQPGQWWHDHVAATLGEKLTRRWLGDCFELVELAVHPASQGQGAGSRLHDGLLGGRRQRTAALSTIQAETTALQLYRRRGWVTVLEDFFFPGVATPFLIMGLDLAKAGWRAPAGGIAPER